MTIEESKGRGDQGWYSEETATLGDRLTGAREALGMSQKELASRIGVRLKAVQHWEENQKEPRANRLQMLAGMLSVPLVWLMTGEGPGLPDPGHAARHDAGDEALGHELRELRVAVAGLATQIGRIEARLGAMAARQSA